MDYVKVINPGSTYTSLATNLDASFWGAYITNGVLPIRGRTYKVIKELDHPANPGVRLMTIMDGSWNAFIIGIDGIEEASVEDWAFEATNNVANTTPPSAPVKPKLIRPITPKKKDKYEVGDIILITDKGSSDFGKKLRVTDPNYRGYDVVTSYTDYGADKSKGFRFDQIERYIPEPELLPDDKPKFSKNELLEVLNQMNKTPEEMILDLMDHITN